MKKTAILVDGGFYQKRSQSVFGDLSPKERADELENYCRRHLNIRNKNSDGSFSYIKEYDLYRIFYYDCPPSSKNVYHPLLKKTIDLSTEPIFNYMTLFINELKRKRKFALRLGSLDENNLYYNLTKKSLYKLLRNEINISDLTENDFKLNLVQKKVDMMIGLDISSMALKKQIDQVVLISGDSDFVPAAKLARREGLDFVLDPLGSPIKDELHEHIDGLITCDEKYIENFKINYKK